MYYNDHYLKLNWYSIKPWITWLYCIDHHFIIYGFFILWFIYLGICNYLQLNNWELCNYSLLLFIILFFFTLKTTLFSGLVKIVYLVYLTFCTLFLFVVFGEECCIPYFMSIKLFFANWMPLPIFLWCYQFVYDMYTQ